MVLTVAAPPERSGPAYTFARHETFHLRDGWLFKGMEALSHGDAAPGVCDAVGVDTDSESLQAPITSRPKTKVNV